MRITFAAGLLRRQPGSNRLYQLGLALGVLFAAWMIFVFSVTGLARYLGVLPLLAAFIFILWKKPFWGMLALVTVGTAHSFLMMLFLRFVGSVTLLKAAQLWKEVVLLVLLLKAVEQAFRRRQIIKITLLDLAIVAFVAIAAFYLAYPNVLPGSTLFSKAMGLRADAFFLVAYFVARFLDMKPKQVRILLIAFAATTVLVAGTAAAQFIAPESSSAIFNQLGFKEYMLVQRGDTVVNTAVRSREIAGIDLPRASSILLSDLVLAFFSLLAAPLATALFLRGEGLQKKVLASALILAAVGITFLTVTRSAIVALVPSLALLVLLSRKYLPSAFLLLQSTVAVLLIAAVTGLTPQKLGDIFSPNEASVRGHLVALDESLQIIQDQPLGRGLGTAGQVAQRFKPPGAITNESWYLQIATEIGVIPSILFIFILASFGITAFIHERQMKDPWLGSLCLGMGGATVALGLVGLTLHAWEGLTVSIIFWLFAGIVVRARELDLVAEKELDAHRPVA